MSTTRRDSEDHETSYDENLGTVPGTILYELLVHTEWQEPEIVLKSQDKVEDIICGKRLTNSRCAGTSSWFNFSPWTWLTDSLIKVKESQIIWQFEVGGDGTFVAILQETILEIRSSKDEYSSVVGRSSVLRDPYAHWRRLQWSPDCSMLAVAYSNGNVEIFDLIGTKLFSIGNVKEFPSESAFDNGEVPSGLLFMEPQVKKSRWAYELLICNLKGQLHSFLLSTVDGYEENHSFDFSKHLPTGVSSICYHPTHNLLFVSSGNQYIDANSTVTQASHHGISAWRILSDYPYYRKSSFEQDDLRTSSKNILLKVSSLFTLIPFIKETIFKMTVSPGGKKLAALHTSGALSIWEIPSLRLHRLWRIPEQPKYSISSSSLFDFQAKRKREQTFKCVSYLTDVNWWTEESIILARNSGSITVSSVNTLQNQLGDSCEWFEPYSRVSTAFNKGFLALECDCQIQSKKHPLMESDRNGSDSSDDEEVSLISRPAKYLRNALYYMTDSERFQPPRRRPKTLSKIFRMVSLKSTTPEELFTRKMDLEEYGEAISLAQVYGLDTDLVYQRQWRKTAVSCASIQDYLSKIKKRSWVLHECLERVPEDIDAARELLTYGLRGSSLECFIAIGLGADDGKFKICVSPAKSQDYVKNIVDEASYKVSSIFCKSEDDILKTIKVVNLTLEQKQLCQVRYKLLTYLDRLITYEVMLGGLQTAAEHFDPKFYQKFRSQSLVDAAAEFARNSNWQSIEIMFTYHREALLPYRLAILSNFPETAYCYEYRHLLPEYDDWSECDDMYLLEGEQRRLPDWCEHSTLREITSAIFQQSVPIYEECPELAKYHGFKLDNKLITEWYLQRAMEIEERSCLVDNALELVKLGRAKNIQGLEDLHEDLTTLETLVYDCQIDFCLEHYRALSDIQRVTLLMSTATDDAYIKYIRRWLLPYLDQCEKKKKGSRINLLREYLVNMAKDDLTRCVQICHHSRIDSSNPVIPLLNDLMDVALECVYVCNRNDQLGKMKSILECLPNRGFGPTTPETIKLHGWVDEFERHLQAAFILNRNQIPQTIKYIRDCQDNAEEVKSLLTKLLRGAGRKSLAVSEEQWKELLADVLSLQKIFQCVSPALCYEIYVESLLCSNSEENIKRSGKLIECSKNEVSSFEKKVQYSRAVPIVVSAATEYFNSSSSLTDPCMELARICLELIQDCPETVQRELDLISAVGMLSDLSVCILPLQVRLCENRMKLIEKVLKTKLDSYHNSQLLLKLAHLLHVAGEDKFEREGSILTLIAQKALENEDYEVCRNLCERIMMAGYSAGWEICYQLGQCKQFMDLEARCHLLSFAVTYCSPDQIEAILKSRCFIELQLLNEKIHSKMELSIDDDQFVDAVSEMDENNKEKESPGLHLKTPIIQTQQFSKKMLQRTSRATKEVLSSLTNQEFWSQAVSWMTPLRQQNTEESEDVTMNEDFQIQGINAYYTGLVVPCYISKLGPDYRHYSYSLNNQAVELSQILLRSALLAEALTGGECSLNALVLANLGQNTITQDCALGIAYLLALNDPMDADECLKLLPNSSASLHVRCYYFALYILSSLRVEFDPFQSWLYLQTPDIIVQMAMQLATMNKDKPIFDDNISSCFTSFRCYYDTLSDLLQGEILHQLSRGVDVVRFSCDAQYKRETILGLAMTMDDTVYNTAITLAEKHNIPLYEVFRTHVEYLFSESSLSAEEIQQRIKKLDVIPEFQKNAESFTNCLLSSIFPTIAGTDHGKLILYYQLLEQFARTPTATEPSVHIKLLREIESAAPSLNYKQLTDDRMNIFQIIEEVLTKDNVNKFANISSQLLHRGQNLDYSTIYCLWSKKLFLEPALSHDAADEEASVDWLGQYEQCRDYLGKLQPLHLVDFVNNTLFSKQGCIMIDQKNRKVILKRIVAFAKKQKGQSQGIERDDWNKSVKELSNTMSHLEWMQSDLVLELKQQDDEDLHQYLIEFDESRSVESCINSLLEKCVLEGSPFSTLQQLISITPPGIEITPSEVVNHAIRHILEVLKGNAKPRYSHDSVEVLKKIITQTQEYVSESKDCLIVEDMLSILRPFCADHEVSIQTRLNILELLEQAFTLDKDNSGLIVLYRTQMFIAAGWPDHEVYPADVETEANRLQLYGRLVEDCSNFQRALMLTKLLTSWPKFPLTRNPEEHPWFRLLMVMLQCPEPERLDLMVSILREHLTNESFLNAQMYRKIMNIVQARGNIRETVKIALVSEFDEIHDIAVEEMLKSNKVPLEEFDEQIMKMILQRHLLPRLVQSHHLYGSVIDYIVSSERTDDSPDYLMASNVAQDLFVAGYEAEAGSLLLQTLSVPTLLQSFQSAFGVARCWLRK